MTQDEFLAALEQPQAPLAPQTVMVQASSFDVETTRQLVEAGPHLAAAAIRLLRLIGTSLDVTHDGVQMGDPAEVERELESLRAALPEALRE